MPQDAPLNGSAPGRAEGPWSRVAGMQAKLHRWAVADPGRRFDDLFNLVIPGYPGGCLGPGAQKPGRAHPRRGRVTPPAVERWPSPRLNDLRAELKEGCLRRCRYGSG